MVHGGLFRAPPPKPQQGRKRRKQARGPLTMGTLEHLRTAFKGGADPTGKGTMEIAGDVLWSDPVPENGIKVNKLRGVGLVFGPDATEVRRFLKQGKVWAAQAGLECSKGCAPCPGKLCCCICAFAVNMST